MAEDHLEFLSEYDLRLFKDTDVYIQKRFFSKLHPKRLEKVPSSHEQKCQRYSYILDRFIGLWIYSLVNVAYKRTLHFNDLKLHYKASKAWDALHRLEDLPEPQNPYKKFSETVRSYYDAGVTQYLVNYPKASPRQARFAARISNLELFNSLMAPFAHRCFDILVAYVGSLLFFMLGSFFLGKFSYLVIIRSDAYGSWKAKAATWAVFVGVTFFLEFLCRNHANHETKLLAARCRAMMTKMLLDKALKLSPNSRDLLNSQHLEDLVDQWLPRLEYGILLLPPLLLFPLFCLVLFLALAFQLSLYSLLALLPLLVVLILLTGWVLTCDDRFKNLKRLFYFKAYPLKWSVALNLRLLKIYGFETNCERMIDDFFRPREYLHTKYLVRQAILFLHLIYVGIFPVVLSVRYWTYSLVVGLIILKEFCFQFLLLPSAVNALWYLVEALSRFNSFISLQEDSEFHAGNLRREVKNSSELQDDEAFRLVDASYKFQHNSLNNAIDTEDKYAKVEDIPTSDDAGNADSFYDNDDDILREEPYFNGFVNLTLSIKKGELIMVTGATNSGRASFFSVLAGAVPKENGKRYVAGKVACSRSPWIQNTTVKENIIFGLPFNNTRFNEVVAACQLENDLSWFPDGISTEIGKRFFDLTSAQQAKIELARCVYEEADIYLIDDILGSLDDFCKSKLMKECIMNMLEGKTRILFTDDLSILENASRIIFISSSGAVDIGTIEELQERNTEFFDFLSNRLFRSSNLSDEMCPLELEDRAEVDYNGSISTVIGISDYTMLEQQSFLSSPSASCETKPHIDRPFGLRTYLSFVRKESGTFILDGILLLLILLILLIFLVVTFFGVSERYPQSSHGYKISAFVLAILLLLTLPLCVGLYYYYALEVSTIFEKHIHKRFLYLPSNIFNIVSMKQLVKQYARDMGMVEYQAHDFFFLFLYEIALVTLGYVTIAAQNYWTFITLPLLIVPLIYLNYYRITQRELRRLGAVSRTSISKNFSDVVNGYDFIKIYGVKERFRRRGNFFIDRLLEVSIAAADTYTWALVPMSFALILVLILSYISMIYEGSNVFYVGSLFPIIFLSLLPRELFILLNASTEFDARMESLSRILTLKQLPVEEHLKSDTESSGTWEPVSGFVSFEGVTITPGPYMAPTLNDVTFKIQPGQKIGICWKGTSVQRSFVDALYRLVSPKSGKIFIDGEDISQVGLQSLRNSISILPSKPVFFGKTVSDILDPDNKFDQNQLQAALDKAALNMPSIEDLEKSTRIRVPRRPQRHPTILSRDKEDSEEASELGVPKQEKIFPSGSLLISPKLYLTAGLNDGGSDLSIIEKQILSLAYVLLHKRKILIIEDDSSYRPESYNINLKVQSLIPTEFSDTTILSLSSSLLPIIHYDQVMIFDSGWLPEIGTARELMTSPASIFRSLCIEQMVSIKDLEREPWK